MVSENGVYKKANNICNLCTLVEHTFTYHVSVFLVFFLYGYINSSIPLFSFFFFFFLSPTMYSSLSLFALVLLCVQLASAGTINVCSSCKFKSISKAIASLPNNAESYTVLIAPGTYTEKFTITRPNLILKPTSGIVTIQYASGHDTSSPTGSTADSAVLTIKGKNVMLENIIIANTFKQGRVANVALHLDAPQAYFKNVKIYGFQDTLLINRSGSGYFRNCHIEGSVDFIWGFGTGKLLENYEDIPLKLMVTS